MEVINELKLGIYAINLAKKRLFKVGLYPTFSNTEPTEASDFSDYVANWEPFQHIVNPHRSLDEDSFIELVFNRNKPVFVSSDPFIATSNNVVLIEEVFKDTHTILHEHREKQNEQNIKMKYKKIGKELFVITEAFIDSGFTREEAISLIQSAIAGAFAKNTSAIIEE